MRNAWNGQLQPWWCIIYCFWSFLSLMISYFRGHIMWWLRGIQHLHSSRHSALHAATGGRGLYFISLDMDDRSLLETLIEKIHTALRRLKCQWSVSIDALDILFLYIFPVFWVKEISHFSRHVRLSFQPLRLLQQAFRLFISIAFPSSASLATENRRRLGRSCWPLIVAIFFLSPRLPILSPPVN